MMKKTKKEIQMVFDIIQSNVNEKRINEAQWNLNFAYYIGDQWKRATLHDTSKLIPSGSPYEKRFVMNYIKPTVDIITARINAANRTILPQPKTYQSDDISAARIAKIVAAGLWEENEIELELARAIPVMACAGSVVIHPYFNKDAGKKYKAEEVNAMYGFTEEDEDFWISDKHEGRVEFDFLSPFEASYSMGAKTDKDCEAWVISKFRTYKWIKDVTGKNIEKEKNTIKFAEGYVNYKRIVDKATDTSDITDGTLVHELWLKPNSEYPNGLLVMTTEGRQELYIGDLPWGLAEEGELPFVKMDYQTILDSFWGKPPVSDARQPQRIINKTWSMYMNHLFNYTHPYLLNPEGNGLDEYDFVNDGSTFLPYIADASEDGGQPRWLQPPPFNPQILDALSICKQNINEIFGVNDISRAHAPSGVKSGRAMQIMGAADDTRMGLLQSQIEIALSKAFSIALKIVANTYKIPRLIKIVGKPNARFVNNFVGSMLNGNTDVKIKMRSVLPLNTASKIDTVLALKSQGIIPNTEDGQRLIYQMLDFEEHIPMLEGGLDYEQAQFENSLLDKGERGQLIEEPVPVLDNYTGEPLINPETNEPYVRMVKRWTGLPTNDWDIDEIHIKVIEDRQKEIEYYNLPPEVKEAYNLHKELHRQRLIRKQEMQAQSAQEQIMKQIELEILKEKNLEKNKAEVKAQAKIKVDDNKAENQLNLQRDKNKGEIAKEIILEKKEGDVKESNFVKRFEMESFKNVL